MIQHFSRISPDLFIVDLIRQSGKDEYLDIGPVIVMHPERYCIADASSAFTVSLRILRLPGPGS